MKNLKKNILKISLASAIVLICMVISTVESDRSNVVSDITGIIAKPFQKIFLIVDNIIDNGFDYFQDMNELKKENASLKSQIALMEGRITKSDATMAENERLRSLVDLKEKNNNYTMTACQVTASDPGGWSSCFIIDKGYEDGISKNCVVIDSGGVLGRIDNVGKNWAKVIAITEPGTACGAEVSRTGSIGIVEGDSALDGTCKMTSIDKRANITPGDYVVTSGSGDIYPPGLTIGKISEIVEEEMSKTAIVEPAANIKMPKEVMVITEKFPKNYEHLETE